ncbi:MAG: outer membrane protein assembly factor BamA, partial [Candidatus Eisenbacteria bacterium]|nr:outer membrane protein assembly factor BamA [Candidatus Eisenbacteria bacterium]
MMQRKLVQMAATLGILLVLAAPLSAAAQTLGSFRVEGNENVSADRILITFGLRLGEELAIEDVREGIRRLYDLGQFSDVRVYAEGEDESGLNVVVAVEERPRVSAVEIEGNDRLDDSDLEPALKLERDDPFIAAALEDMRVAVLEIYRDKGFPQATVETRTEEVAGNAVRVTLSIVENTRVTVRKIRFEGNEAFEAADLKKSMETKEDRWWRTDAFFDADVVEEDLRRITELYRKDGYIDARTVGYSAEYDDEGENVTLTVTIEEGSLYEVSGIEWVGASDFAVDALYDLTLVEPGETYKPSDTEQTIRDAYNWYRERGYIYASVRRLEDLEEDGAVRVTFSVDEGEPARIGQIHIVGNERTKEKVIRRELTVEPGDLYRTSEIMASLHRIGNLGFFTDPWVDFAESGEPQQVDLVFSVKERQTGRAGVGVSHTSERGITGFLEITEGNLFGNGQYLDLKWEFGKRSTEVVLGFTEPWFMGRRLSVGFDLYDTDDKRTYGGLSEDFYDSAFKESPDYDSVVNCVDCDRDYIVERE